VCAALGGDSLAHRCPGQCHPSDRGQQCTEQRAEQVKRSHGRTIGPEQQHDVDSERGEGGVTDQDSGADELSDQRTQLSACADGHHQDAENE